MKPRWPMLFGSVMPLALAAFLVLSGAAQTAVDERDADDETPPAPPETAMPAEVPPRESTEEAPEQAEPSDENPVRAPEPVLEEMADDQPSPPPAYSTPTREPLPVRTESSSNPASSNSVNRRSRETPRTSQPRSRSRPSTNSDRGNSRNVRSIGEPSPTTGASARDFSRFKIISERNIFNAHRSARQVRRSEDTRRPTVQVDTFTLVGTLIYENRAYAFFDGSRSEFKKVLESGKKLADYTLKKVDSNSVTLQGDTGTVELQVGAQMRRTDEGWRTASSSAPLPDSEIGASSPSSSSGQSTTEESDIIKRLMQQRERELQNAQ